MQNRYQQYISHVRKQVIIFDGAMGTNLQELYLTAQHYGGEKYFGCNDILNLTHPEAIASIHHSFLDVGIDVIETNTFRSNRITLAEFGLSEKTDAINFNGAQIARKAADAYTTDSHIRFVAGSMGPTGKLLSLPTENEDSQKTSFDEIRDVYCQQAQSLIAGGVDLLLLETAQDILEVKAAILGIHDAFEKSNVVLPIQVQVTLDTNGHMLLGTDIDAVLTIIEGMAIDVIGINCSTGPAHMELALKYLSEHSSLPISCLPNAGLPINRDGIAIYPLTAEDFATEMMTFIEKYNLSTVGGCCGTTPEHLRKLVERIGRRPRAQNNFQKQPALSSAFHSVSIEQEPAPFLIGERLNTQGSRKFKKMMLKNDIISAVQLGKQQVAGGAHALDICTALTEDDNEAERTTKLVKLISQQVDIPLVIDSTDVEVMRAGLKCAPGRCLLNSVNLENGEEKAKQVLLLAKQFNAAVIALTIDENGMAATAEKKLEIAQRIYHLAVETCGLDAGALIFDPLTFTLASGSTETADAANQTLEGIRLIKQKLPDTHTTLGVSNISFGLTTPARNALNSVFLYHAVKAGLDMAILNPQQITPYASISTEVRTLAEDVIFNRAADSLQKYIKFFESDHADPGVIKDVQIENLSIEEKIGRHILFREANDLEKDIDAYINTPSRKDQQEKALDVLNKILLPAMGEIGSQFASGELILPFVLQSAEIMRSATNHLDQYLEKTAEHTRGTLVLATVYGDVHDIGKNLINTIVSNNGYEVIDLGKQVPAETIIEKAFTIKADAIGLSALLVSTSQQMPLIVNMLQERGAKIPVLIGGAAVNQSFAERISATEEGRPYAGGVHYCKDAFDALKALASIEVEKKDRKPHKKQKETRTDSQPGVRVLKTGRHSWHQTEIPTPPFWGARTIPLPLEDLFKRINRSALYRLAWGVGKVSGEKWITYQGEFDARFQKMHASMINQPWLKPQAAYGYWRCTSDGNGIVILPNGDKQKNKPIHFDLPRQNASPFLCLSDYFAPTGHTEPDLAAFQLVTIGNEATEYVHALQEKGDLVESYFAHGLAVQLTEAAAVYMHEMIRAELKIAKDQGKRYSWGYPPIPDLSQQAEIVRILNAKETLNIKLTSAYQFVPEYSTAAIIVHHPEAKYFQIDLKGKA
ncbi:MAG: methionine synthase [Pelolinea sp.]|nr:methionine synthase [Pelolinea sp.]